MKIAYNPAQPQFEAILPILNASKGIDANQLYCLLDVDRKPHLIEVG